DARTILQAIATANGRSVANNRLTLLVFPPETAVFCHVVEASDELALSARELIEIARPALRGHIAEKYSEKNQLPAILVDPELEQRFAKREEFDSQQMRQLFKSVNSEVVAWREQNPTALAQVLLLTASEVRPAIGSAFREALPELPVISYLELPDDISITQVGRLELAELPEDLLKIRKELQSNDDEIDEQLNESLPAGTETAGTKLDETIQGMIGMTAYLKKLNARTDKLRETDDDHLRELLTQEIDTFEAEMNKQTFIEPSNEDLTDLLSDFFR